MNKSDFMSFFEPTKQFFLTFLVLGSGLFFTLVFISYFESFLIARIQRKTPPSFVCAFARNIKYIFKLPVLPKNADKKLFFLAPISGFVLSLFLLFMLIPYGKTVHIELGILYALFMASLGGYVFVIAGWSSASRLSFFGAIRAFAQTISCQLIFTAIALVILMSAGSANIEQVVKAQQKIWFIFPHFPMAVLFVLSGLMMMSAKPFDALKAFKDLGTGATAEYTGILYLLFLWTDSLLLLILSLMGSVFFLGGWLPIFGLTFIPAYVWLAVKSLVFLSVFILIKATFSSYRIDQLMRLSFKVYLPLAMTWVMLTGLVLLLLRGGK